MTTTARPDTLPTVGATPPARLANPIGENSIPLDARLRALFGLPFAGTGLFTLSIGVRQLLGEQVEGAHAPAPVFLGVALLFGGAGLWLTGGGVAQLLADRARARRRARFPDQPWLSDYPWDRLGGRDRAPRELGLALFVFVTFATFAGLFGWAGFAGDGGFPFEVAAVLLVAGAVATGAHFGRVAWRTLRWGRSRIRFADFPMVPGGEVELLLDDLAPAVRAVPARATLRCVQERWETRPSGRRERTTEVVHYTLWEAAQALPAGAPRVRFAVPADAPGSDLASRPARYWELELVAEVPGVDCRASFLVPVYPPGA